MFVGLQLPPAVFCRRAAVPAGRLPALPPSLPAWLPSPSSPALPLLTCPAPSPLHCCSLFPCADDEYWSEDEEEEVQSPIDAVDPFIFFAGGLLPAGFWGDWAAGQCAQGAAGGCASMWLA